MATLVGWWRVVVNIPNAITWDDEDFDRRTMLKIVRRTAKSRYYDKHAKQQVCGCFAVGDHFTSYMMDCENHGIDAIFPDDES